MCIICNTPFQHGPSPADEFLTEFARAQASMKSAAQQMLAVSKIANTPKQRWRYGATHKRMVRLMREWNSLEQFRENAEPPPNVSFL